MKAKRLVIFLLIIVVLAVVAVYYPYFSGKTTGKTIVSAANYAREPAYVERVIDGDTIVVSGRDIGNNTHIRLLGLNTPEHGQAYSNEATDFLKSEIEGQNVELLRDISDTDQYQRKLRYVFYDNRLMNVEIVENGFAPTFMLDGLKYEDKLKAAENFARNSNIGLWKRSSDVCGECIKLDDLNYKNEYFIIRNDCSFTCNLKEWFVKDDANHFFYLDVLDAGMSKKYVSASAFDSNGKAVKGDVWNNDGDRFFMRDSNGGLVIFYEYSGDAVN